MNQVGKADARFAKGRTKGRTPVSSVGSSPGSPVAPKRASEGLRLSVGFLALGFLLTTLPLYAPNFRLYVSLGAQAAVLGPYNLAMAVTVGFAGLGCAVASVRRPAWHGLDGVSLWVACAGYAAAFAGLMACAFWGAPALWVPYALGVLGGACAVPVVLAWISRLSGDLRCVFLHMGLSCGLAALLTWLLGRLPPQTAIVVAIAATAVGACAPAAMLPGDGLGESDGRGSLGTEVPGGRSGVDVPTSGEAVRGAASPAVGLTRNLLSILWLPFLGFLVFVFISGSYRFPESLMPLDTELTGALLALAVTFAACLPRWRTPLALVVEKVVAPACVACSMVLGSFPTDSPLFLLGAASVFAPLIFMGIYAGALLAVVSKSGEFPLVFTVGILLFITCAVSTAGVSILNFVRFDVGPWAWVVICAYFGVFVVDLGISSWRRIVFPGSEAPLAVRDDDGDASCGAVESKVDALCRDCGLSGREGEILGYLARGYNSTYIAKALFISSNTVRSHIYNLYRKLGIKSRAELLELVNS